MLDPIMFYLDTIYQSVLNVTLSIDKCNLRYFVNLQTPRNHELKDIGNTSTLSQAPSLKELYTLLVYIYLSPYEA